MSRNEPFLGGHVRRHDTIQGELADVVSQTAKFCMCATEILEDHIVSDNEFERLTNDVEQMIREALDALTRIREQRVLCAGQQSLGV